RLYMLDITAEKAVKLATEIRGLATFPFESLGITPGGHSVIVTTPNGDLTRLLAVDVDHPDRARTFIDLPGLVSGLDIGPDGSLYLDQAARPGEVLRFSSSGKELEHLNVLPTVKGPYGVTPRAVHSREGKTWVVNNVGGRDRILVVGSGQEPTPFIDTDEE